MILPLCRGLCAYHTFISSHVMDTYITTFSSVHAAAMLLVAYPQSMHTLQSRHVHSHMQ